MIETLISLWTEETCETATEVLKNLLRKELKTVRYPLLRCPDFMVHSKTGCVIPNCAHHGDYPDLLMAVLEKAPRVDVERRLLSLLSLCTPSDAPLCKVLDSKFVSAVVSNKFHKVFHRLTELAFEDVTVLMSSCVRACVTKTYAEWQSDIETAREVIFIMFSLGVIDMYNFLFRVAVNVLQSIISAVEQRTAPETDIHACINMMYKLFTVPSVLHKKSTLSLLLTSKLTRFPKAIHFMGLLDQRKAGMLPKYKHVDMSDELGSRWLRALVRAPEELEAEERAHGFCAEQALHSRLSSFLRLKKAATKRNIINVVVDGCNLLQFAITHGCDSNSRLGRVLLESVVYFVTDEDPGTLDPVMYRQCFDAIRDTGLHSTYMSSVRSLSHRVKTVFQNATATSVMDIMAALRTIVASGFTPECITLYVCTDKCCLKNRDMTKWRALLRDCLSTFPVQLDDTYEVVFENKPLEEFALLYL